jgi:hypothetical protein
VTVTVPDIGKVEVVSPTDGVVRVLYDGEGQGVLLGGFCTLDDSPVPATSDGERRLSATDIYGLARPITAWRFQLVGCAGRTLTVDTAWCSP